MFGVALYGIIILSQMLISVETYISMLNIFIVKIAIHALVFVNSYFLLKGERYYNENVGAE